MDNKRLRAIDRILDKSIEIEYPDCNISCYASGYGSGVRERAYDVTNKDGTKVVEAKFDTGKGSVTISIIK